MPHPSPQLDFPLPKHWPSSLQAALLHVIALAQYALVSARGWAANSSSERVRLKVNANQLEQQIALLREQIGIKNARIARIPANLRPHYLPTERLAILELRAACGWSLAQTAKIFQVTTNTISSWSKRLDEDGPDALLAMRQPVNKFPDFVAYIVQRLATLCPQLGKVKIAQVLARAGLHLGATTVGRMRRQKPAAPPAPTSRPMPSATRVTAKCPNNVWHVDLTTVPTAAGFWTTWLPLALPLALPQCWPFCWWVAIVLDHYSRRMLGITVFFKQPTSQQVRQFLGSVIARIGTPPKYLVTDSGGQFTAPAFKTWCRRHGIRQRKGAIGRHGSIAVLERFIRTLKESGIRLLPVVSLLRRSFQRELHSYRRWYNQERPHTTLAGATPEEVYFTRRPACRAPRFEPRPAWPRGSPCAGPTVLVKGQPGVCLQMTVQSVARRRHLPRVTLSRVA
jgi:transposase InsO family protein